jgi:hypothetical protein
LKNNARRIDTRFFASFGGRGPTARQRRKDVELMVDAEGGAAPKPRAPSPARTATHVLVAVVSAGARPEAPVRPLRPIDERVGPIPVD